MATPTKTETLNNIYSTTWNLMRKKAMDNIFTATPLWLWLYNRQKITETGGRDIGIQLMYGKNNTVTTISKGGTVSIADTEFLTTAIYDWKYAVGSIINYKQDADDNQGKAAIFKLVNAKLDNLKLSLIDDFERQLFADGTGNSSQEFNGLDNIVDASPATGTVGGINAANYTWWRNQQQDASGAFSSYGITDMRTLFNDCSRGKGQDSPDFIIADQTSYEYFEGEMLEYVTFNNRELADAGFDNITFKGKPTTWSSECTSGYMYFLNSRYLEFVARTGTNFEMTPWKAIPNQLDYVAQVVVAGNFVCSNRSRQGVLTGITN